MIGCGTGMTAAHFMSHTSTQFRWNFHSQYIELPQEIKFNFKTNKAEAKSIGMARKVYQFRAMILPAGLLTDIVYLVNNTAGRQVKVRIWHVQCDMPFIADFGP